MSTYTRARGTAIALLAAGLALAGCGSDTKTEPTTTSSASSNSASSSSSAAPSTTATAASGPNETIADYVAKAGITETPVAKGEAGAPVVTLPIPEGWVDADAEKPKGAYSAMNSADPAAAKPVPTIVAMLVKLSDPAKPDEVLRYAAGEVKNLPGFEGGSGEMTKLGGFDGFQIGGTYDQGGGKLFVAQKTIVIPSPNGLYVLQLNAKSTEDGMGGLLGAMSAIDEQTTITL
jgi:hypothetical protein